MVNTIAYSTCKDALSYQGPKKESILDGIPLSLAYDNLGGGFKYFSFHPYLGKISNLTNIFQMGWNHQPDDLISFTLYGPLPGAFCLNFHGFVWIVRTDGSEIGNPTMTKRGTLNGHPTKLLRTMVCWCFFDVLLTVLWWFVDGSLKVGWWKHRSDDHPT